MRISSIGFCLILAGVLIAATGAQAQGYPTKPVRVDIPLTAGSGVDVVGRWVSHKREIQAGLRNPERVPSILLHRRAPAAVVRVRRRVRR